MVPPTPRDQPLSPSDRPTTRHYQRHRPPNRMPTNYQSEFSYAGAGHHAYTPSPLVPRRYGLAIPQSPLLLLPRSHWPSRKKLSAYREQTHLYPPPSDRPSTSLRR